ncbi:MAG: DUF5678 domain-containing protein [Verrucomicrobia bacterium]|jgi:hypothetical protein|nr:DUF5678 domain-containing protein [Verrucomicrobiota bacterium]
METIMANPLETEFNYYLEHQNELVEKFGGKHVVIKDQKVIGSYDSEVQAIQETVKSHRLGTFLVQKCEPGSAGYTQTYHSRVAFA